MKRSKEKADRDEDQQEDQQTLFASEISEAMRYAGNRFISEQSYVPIEGLMFGRQSFQGMNPEIEKIMAANKAKKVEINNAIAVDGKKKQECDIDDNAMAATIGRKFQTKRNKNLMVETENFLSKVRTELNSSVSDHDNNAKRKRFKKETPRKL